MEDVGAKHNKKMVRQKARCVRDGVFIFSPYTRGSTAGAKPKQKYDEAKSSPDAVNIEQLCR